MITKYGFEMRAHDIEVNIRRLSNPLLILIPLRDLEEDWLKQLDTVIIEIAGLNEIFIGPQLLQLLCKLEGLKTIETGFELYRKTVFESISLLQELNHGIRL